MVGQLHMNVDASFDEENGCFSTALLYVTLQEK